MRVSHQLSLRLAGLSITNVIAGHPTNGFALLRRLCGAPKGQGSRLDSTDYQNGTDIHQPPGYLAVKSGGWLVLAGGTEVSMTASSGSVAHG